MRTCQVPFPTCIDVSPPFALSFLEPLFLLEIPNVAFGTVQCLEELKHIKAVLIGTEMQC